MALKCAASTKVVASSRPASALPLAPAPLAARVARPCARPAPAARPTSTSARRVGHQQICHAGTASVTLVSETRSTDVVVEVLPSEAAIAPRLCEIIEATATAAIAANGKFFMAVAGGSVLKACAGLVGRPIPWDKVHLFYVNHKTVANDDKDSTHKKALGLFITKTCLPLSNVVILGGSSDAAAEAKAYEAQIKKVAEEQGMEKTAAGVPRLDLVLLGMGGDGHVGSLYPDRPEIQNSSDLVVAVAKKDPASITMSRPMLSASKKMVLAVTGGSKAASAKIALESEVPIGKLPAQNVKPSAGTQVWLMDPPAAAELTSVKALQALL